MGRERIGCHKAVHYLNAFTEGLSAGHHTGYGNVAVTVLPLDCGRDF